MPSYTLGVDFGKERDFSVAVLVEHVWRLPPEEDAGLARLRRRGVLPEFEPQPEDHVVFAERWPLRTPYTAVVDRLGEIVTAQTIRGNTLMMFDRTGVGNAVSEMIAQAYKKGRLGDRWPVGITITSGQTRHGYNVPKTDLISGLAVRLEQRGRLRIADGIAHADQFRKELEGFRRKVTESGYDSYGAETEAVHDDFVIALAIACWDWRRYPRGEPRILAFDGIGEERWDTLAPERKETTP